MYYEVHPENAPGTFFLYLFLTMILGTWFTLIAAKDTVGIKLLLGGLQGQYLYKDHIVLKLSTWFISLAQLGLSYTMYILFKKELNNDDDSEDEEINIFVKAFAIIGTPLCFMFIFIFIQVGSVPFIISSMSKDYITFKNLKILSNEKVFVKDNKIVKMIPMIHIGEKGFYKDILKNLGDKKTAFLLEGVEDKQQLLKKISYRNLAEVSNLSTQHENFDPETAANEQRKNNISVVLADLDTSVFDKDTIKYLNKVSEALSFNDLTSFTILFGMGTNLDLPPASLMDDLINKRNDYLMSKFHEATNDNEIIIIPWGALHLPDIEKRLVADGYKQVEEGKSRIAIDLVKGID